MNRAELISIVILYVCITGLMIIGVLKLFSKVPGPQGPVGQVVKILGPTGPTGSRGAPSIEGPIGPTGPTGPFGECVQVLTFTLKTSQDQIFGLGFGPVDFDTTVHSTGSLTSSINGFSVPVGGDGTYLLNVMLFVEMTGTTLYNNYFSGYFDIDGAQMFNFLFPADNSDPDCYTNTISSGIAINQVIKLHSHNVFQVMAETNVGQATSTVKEGSYLTLTKIGPI